MLDGAKNLDEICHCLDLDKSGNISSYLHELVIAGFISEDKTWNLKENITSNLKKFRLKDNYIRFYLKFIEPNKSKIIQLGQSTDSIAGLVGWESIMGLQFENLVINNSAKLCELLGISIQVPNYSFFSHFSLQ